MRHMCCERRLLGQLRLRSTLCTLVLGCCLLVFLHFLISSEYSDEAVYFSSLNLPYDPLIPMLGIRRVEDLPSSGKPCMPRRIHQTWKTEHIPRSLVEWIKSWSRNHPGWEYWLWTDTSARQLIKERFPALLPVFDAYPDNIQRADALRYVVLHEFGGIYADLDMESLRPLDPLTFRYACFVGQEPYAHPILDTNTETLVINALMACRPQHPFMKMVIDSLPDFAHMWSLLDRTGPHFLSYVFKKYTRDHPQYPPEHDNGTYLAPAEYFYPNIDPEKFGYFYRRCKNYDQLGALQKTACQNLQKTRPASKRMALAFTTHHWIHTYLRVKVSLQRLVPIKEIVPNVKIFS